MLYILALVVGYFFVKDALNTSSAIAVDEEKVIKHIDEKPVDVTLKINSGRNDIVFELRMNNTNTVLDILDKLTTEGGLKFERTAYTYGTEIEHINSIYATDSLKWKVLMKVDREQAANQIQNLNLEGEEADIVLKAVDERLDITRDIGKVNLVDQALIEIELTRI